MKKMLLFTPIEINGMKLKNRLGLPPLLNMPANKDCTINDEVKADFESLLFNLIRKIQLHTPETDKEVIIIF